jgi:hypothetical protein
LPSVPTDEELGDQDTEKLKALLKRRKEAGERANQG